MCVGQYSRLRVDVVVVTPFYTLACVLSSYFSPVALQIVTCPPPFGRGGRAQRGRRGQTMTIPKDNAQLENARRLRREMTSHERKLWYLFLRKYPVKVYKQRIIGRFIVDFYCASARLVIELDGSQHYDPQGLAYDAERSQFLTAHGLEVLRFSNSDVDRDFRGVCAQIDLIIQKRL